MRTVPAAHQTHLDTGSLSDKHLVKITRRDGTVKRLTDLDVDIVVAGDGTYTGGFCTVNSVTWGMNSEASSLDADVLVGDLSPLNESEVVSGYYSDATVEVSLVNWADPTQRTPLFIGFIGDIAYDDARGFRFQFDGLWARAAMMRMRTVGPNCDTEVGHPTWCKMPIRPADDLRSTAYALGAHVRHSSDGSIPGYQNRMFEATVAGTTGAGAPAWNYTVGATTVDGGVTWTAREAWIRHATVASLLSVRHVSITVTEPRAVNNWFALGAGKWHSGNNTGQSFSIRKWVAAGAELYLWERPRGAMQVGDLMEIYAGCNLTLTHCRDKFANARRFMGFPQLIDLPRGGA